MVEAPPAVGTFKEPLVGERFERCGSIEDANPQTERPQLSRIHRDAQERCHLKDRSRLRPNLRRRPFDSDVPKCPDVCRELDLRAMPQRKSATCSNQITARDEIADELNRKQRISASPLPYRSRQLAAEPQKIGDKLVL